jgi:ribosomal protein S18 acetylase RimI-like enzyme
MKLTIREYNESDEKAWVRCRVISFLDTAYYDNVYQKKERYENPSIELVAEMDGKIVGLLDLEYDNEKGDVCYKSEEIGGVIWHLAVHPDYRRNKIADKMLEIAVEKAKEQNCKIIQAWTRDDIAALEWYKKNNFTKRESYYHVYVSGSECDLIDKSEIKGMYLDSGFCHYLGKDHNLILKNFSRFHECNLFELNI